MFSTPNRSRLLAIFLGPPGSLLGPLKRPIRAMTPPALAILKRLPFNTPTLTAVDPAEISIAPLHPTGRVPAAILPEMVPSTATRLVRALLPAVSADSAHATPRLAEHGAAMPQTPRDGWIPTVPMASDPAVFRGVVSGEGNTLASVLWRYGTVGGGMGIDLEKILGGHFPELSAEKAVIFTTCSATMPTWPWTVRVLMAGQKTIVASWTRFRRWSLVAGIWNLDVPVKQLLDPCTA